jgi:ornithine carbamoyltransferase
MTRYGMDVTLAHPQGYDVMADTRGVAATNAARSGGSFTVTHSMEEAFEGADIVCPKSWAPFQAMQERTDLYDDGGFDGIAALEQRLLQQNAEHKDWATTEAMMASTRDGKALYMHPLPADITGLSCAQGEVDRSVFERFRVPLYQQAGNKPYAIAAMIFLQKVRDPAAKLQELWDRDLPRRQR